MTVIIFMFNNFSYRISFILALALHLILLYFLFVKFPYEKPKVGVNLSYNFINAVAISERDLKARTKKPKVLEGKVKKKRTKRASPPSVAKKKPVIKKEIKKKVIAKKVIKESLLAEKKRVMDELKKEQEEYQKDQVKQRELEMEKALNEELLAEKAQLAKDVAEAHGMIIQGKIGEYEALIKQAIDSEWIKPDGVAQGDFCRFLAKFAPGGEVISLQLLESSGNDALERSARAAVSKASPLPVPEDERLFNEFRVIKLVFNPEGLSRG